MTTNKMIEELELLFKLMDYEVYKGESAGFFSPYRGSKKFENIHASKSGNYIDVSVATYPIFKHFSIKVNGNEVLNCQSTYDKCSEVRDKITSTIQQHI